MAETLQDPEAELRSITPFSGKGAPSATTQVSFGHLGTAEVLTIDPDRNPVIQKKSSNVIHEVAVQKGMETLFENALGLFKAGRTTLEEVLRVTSAG